MTDQLVVAEIEAFDPDADNGNGAAVTLYFSDRGFVSAGTDTPAHQWMAPRLSDAGGFSRRAFARGVSGRAEGSFGRLVLENKDGELNSLTRLAFDGRQVTVRTGVPGAAYPDEFDVALVARVTAVRLGRGQSIDFSLGPALEALDKPITETRFAGDNVLPDGVEGTPDDLKDRIKPLVLGRVLNLDPPLVNSVRNVYQVSQKYAVIEKVMSAGIDLQKRQSHASLASLMAATAIGESRYDVFEDAGGTYFRLGFEAKDTITADAVDHADPAERTIAKVFKRAALFVGLTLSQSTLDDLATLDADAPYEVGIWLSAKELALSKVFDALSISGGAAWWTDRTGNLRVVALAEPASVVWTLTDAEVLSASAALEGPSGNGVPAKGVDIGYARIEKSQSDSDLAASVPADRRAYLKENERRTLREDATVAARHPAAETLKLNTRLINAADAEALAARLLALHGSLRMRLALEISSTVAVPETLDIGTTLSITLPRLSISDQPMRVIGFDYKPAQRRIKLDLWA